MMRAMRFFAVVAVAVAAARSAGAATLTATQSGSWNSAATWGGTNPTASDVYLIPSPYVVTLAANTTAAALTIASGGGVNAGSFTLTVSQNTTIDGTFTGALALSPGGFNLAGTGNVNGTLQFLTGGSRNISNGTILAVTGQIDVQGSVTNNGIITSSDTANGITGSGSWTQGGTGRLNVSGPITVSSFSAGTSGNIVDLRGTGQTIRATTYHHLFSTTGGTKTLGGATTVNGDLNIGAGIISDGGYQLTAAGTGTLTMAAFTTLRIGDAFSTNLTSLPAFTTYALSASSTITFEAQAAQSIPDVPYGVLAITPGNGVTSVTKTATGNITTLGNLQLTNGASANLTFDANFRTVTVGDDLLGDATISFGGGTISVAGDNVSFSGAITPSYNIKFHGSSASAIRGTTYHNLTINKIGASGVLAGSITITNDLAITSGTLDDNNFQIVGNGAGLMTMAAGTSLLLGQAFPTLYSNITLNAASTVDYRANSAQVVATAPSYGIIMLSAPTSSNTKTLDGISLTAGTLTLSAGSGATVTFDHNGKYSTISGSVTHSGAGSSSIVFGGLGGLLTIGGDFSNSVGFTSAGSAIVRYNGTGNQNVRAGSYEYLTIDKASGIASLTGATTVTGLTDVANGTLSLGSNTLSAADVGASSGILSLGTGTLNLGGNLSVGGSVTTGVGSTINVNGTIQSIWGGGGTFNVHNLTVNNSSGMAMNNSVVLAGTLTLAGGIVDVVNPASLTAPVVTRTSGWVKGSLGVNVPNGSTITFPVGGSSTYFPLAVKAVTGSGNVFVTAVDGQHPGKTGADILASYWTITSGVPAIIDLAMNYPQGNVAGIEDAYVIGHWNGSGWLTPVGAINRTTNVATVTSQSAYTGDWTVGYGDAMAVNNPSIGSFSPTSGSSGTVVTIYGSNFTGATGVTFNGTAAASYTVNSDNQITATVASGSTTGPIGVSGGAGSGNSSENFTVNAPQTFTTVTSGDWNNPATWGGGGFPGALDTANVGHAVNVTAAQSVATVNLSAGSIGGAQTLTITSAFNWTGGDLLTDGASLLLAGTCATTISGASARGMQRDVDNAGSVTVTATGTITQQDNVFTNNGTFVLQSDASWVRFNAPSFVNASGKSFTKNTASGTTTWNVATTNNGTMTFAAGTMNFTDGFGGSGVTNVTAGTLRLSGSGNYSGSYVISTGALVEYTAGTHVFSGSQAGVISPLRIAGATFVASGTPSIDALLLDSGSLSGSGNVTVTTKFDWNGGDLIDTTGALTLGSGCTTTIAGTTARSLERTLSNAGNLTVTGTATITQKDMTVTNSGTWTFQSGMSWVRFNAPSFTNTVSGTVTKSVSGNVAFQVAFTNNGTLAVSGGSISFSDAFSNANAVSLAAGTSLTLSGTGSSSGSFAVGSTATVNYVSGTHTFTGSTSGVGSLLLSGATVSFNGTPSATNLVLTGGSLSGSGTLAISSQFTWSGGNLNDASGTLQLQGTCLATISGGSARQVDRLVTNAGTLDVTATGTLTFYTTLTNTNLIELQADTTFARFNAPAIVNNGTIRKTSGTGISSIDVDVNNSNGIVQVETGRIHFSQSFATGPGSGLSVGIGGLTPQTQHGQVSFANAVTLNGNLAATISGPYVPQGGDAYTVVTFPSSSGAFGSTSLTFGTGRSFAPAVNASNVVLTASGPTISTVSPVSGSNAGGTAVTLTGTGFTAGGSLAVTIGGSAATGVTVDSPTQISLTTPAHASGLVDVVLTNGDGQPTTKFNGYTYAAAAATYTSVANGNWSNPATWGGTAPSSIDSAIVVHNVTVDTPSTINNLTVNGGALIGTNALTVNGIFTFGGGQLTGSGGVTIAGTGAHNWSAGTLNGALTLASGRTMTITGSGAAISSSATLTNNGTITMSGATSLTINSGVGGVINNAGTFDIGSNLFLVGSCCAPGLVFNNSGTFLKSGSGTSSLSPYVTFSNTGAVNISAGTLSLQAGGNNTAGTFTISGGATLSLAGGSHTFGGSSSVTGGGSVSITSGVANFNVLGGFSANALLLAGGTANFNGAGTVSKFTFTSGTLGGGGGLQVSGAGPNSWSGGTLTGLLQVQPTYTLAITGSVTLGTNGNLTNYGTVNYIGGTISVDGGALASIHNHGAFDIQGDLSLADGAVGSANAAFINNNSATLTKSSGSGVASIGSYIPLTNYGTINVSSGTLRLIGGGTSQSGSINVNSATATFDLNAGSFIVSGSAAFSSSGIVKVSGANVNFGGAAFTTPEFHLTGGAAFTISPISTAKLTFSGGALRGTSGVTVTGAGPSNWTGGTLGGVGISNLIVDPGAVLNIGGSVVFALGGTLTNGGTIEYNSGQVAFDGGASALIQNNGSFDVNGDLSFANGAAGSGSSSFVNNAAGTFTKTAGSGTTAFDTFAAFTNNGGTVNVGTGTLALSGGSTFNSGTLNLGFGTILELTAGTHALGGTLSVGSNGRIRANGGTVTVGVPINTAQFELTAGSLAANSAIAANQVTFTGGTLSGTGGVVAAGAGPHTWSAGQLQGKLVVDPGRTLTLGGTASFGSGAHLKNDGSVNWTGGTLTLHGGAGANLENNGTFEVAGDFSMVNGTAGAANSTFTNLGVLRKSAGTGVTSFGSNLSIVQDGTVDVMAGRVSFAGNYQSGTFSQLYVYLGGTTLGTQYTQLAVGGTATLGGTLGVFYTGGFTPASGNTFTVLQGGTTSGDFATKNGLSYSGGSLTYGLSPSAVTLTAGGATADVTVSKSGSVNATTGQNIIYTLFVSNLSSADPATNVTLSDALSGIGLTYVSHSAPAGWTCNGGTTFTCSAASLAASSSATILLTVTTPGTPGAVSNVANVAASNEAPANNANNSSTFVTNVAAATVDLALGMTASPATIAAPGGITYTLTVINNGTATATNVTVTDPIPAQFTYSGSTTTQGACGIAGGVVTCNLGALAPAANATITLTVNTAGYSGTIENLASVTATEGDSVPANNSAGAPVVVSGTAQLLVTNANAAGSGSLAQAIVDLNQTAPVLCNVPCTIAFNIPGPMPVTIAVPAPLAVTRQAVVNGASQPGYSGAPLIFLDGMSNTQRGFRLQAAGSTVRGFSMGNFADTAISIEAGNQLVAGNYLGLTFVSGFAPNGAGLRVLAGSGSVIGGTTAGDRNVISGNTGDGIELAASQNTVIGNYIGVATDGTTPKLNGQHGIRVLSSDHRIGGNGANEGNVIAGNGGAGVALQAGVTTTAILRNLIHSNTSLGIDHGINGTPDLGAPTPVISAAVVSGGSLYVTFSSDATSYPLASAIQLEVFRADPSGEGQLLVGTQCFASTNLASVTQSFPAGSVTAGMPIVATATPMDAGCVLRKGNTTEFSAAFTATGCTPPVTAISGPSSVCANGTATYSVPAVAGGTYAWSQTGAAANGVTNGNTFTVTAGATGPITLNVTVTDGFGCSNAGTASVAVNANPTTAITAPTTVCAASTGNTASVVPQAGATYAWTITNGTITAGAGTSNINFTAGPSGNVQLGVSITAATCTTTGTQTIPITAPPAATVTAPGSACANSSGNAASVVPMAGATYAWSITNGTITAGAGTSNITFTAGATGNVVVSVTVTTGACSSAGTATTTITPQPVATITAPASTCPSSTGNLASVPAQAGATYVWSIANGAITGGSGTNAITFTAGSVGNVQLTATVTTSGCSATSSATTNISVSPAATIAAPATVCPSTTGIVASVAPVAGATYVWTITNGTITAGQGTDTLTFTSGATGSVQLGVTLAAGGCTSTGTHTAAINAAPAVTIAAPPSVCAFSTGNNASTAAVAGASYAWTITNGTITFGQTSPNVIFDAGASGDVVLAVTVSVSGCSSSGTQTVTNNPAPSATITAPGSVDANSSGHTASVPSTAGATYTWTVTGGSLTAGQGTRTITFSAGNSGNVTLKAVVAANGCSNTAQKTVTVVSANPADLSITKSGPASVAAGGTLTYTLTVTNHGPNAATGVRITDVMPGAVTLTGASGSGVVCSTTLSTVTCTTSSLANGGTATVTITATAPNVAATLVNTAEVDATSSDPASGNNSASATTAVAGNSACSTAPPSLVSPANGAENLAAPLAFTWSSVSGATSYELWLATDGAAATLAATTAATNVSVAVASGPSEWYVVARFAGACEPLVSATRTFTVRAADGCAAHTAPQLASPTGGNVPSPVTFNWMPVPQAIGYRVWIRVNGQAAQDLGATDGATFFTAAVPPGRITWFVDAVFNGCPATRSEPATFIAVDPNACSSAKPTLVAPAGGTTVPARIEFSWNGVPNAVGYRVWIAQTGGVPQSLGATTDTTLREIVPPGSYHWFVEALAPGCPAVESDRSPFTVATSQSCGNDRPALTSPAANAATTSASVTFAWSVVPNAIEYELWLALDSGTPSLLGSTAATSLTREVAPGRLTWFVRALFNGCPARDSQRSTFRFEQPEACNGSRPLLIAPGEGSRTVTSPVTFRWGAVPGATKYELYVAGGTGTPALTATTTAPLAENVTLQAGIKTWFVRAYFAQSCPTRDSTPSRFAVIPQRAACGDLARPRISAPSSVSSGVGYTIAWEAVAGANGYVLQRANNSDFSGAQVSNTNATSADFTDANNGSTPIARFYRLRAADTRCTPPTLSAFSATVGVFILPRTNAAAATPAANAQNVTYTIPLGADLAGASFEASADRPWLSVTPSSGVVPAGGMNLTVTANTAGLSMGSNLGGITVTLNTPSLARGRAVPNGNTSVKTTVSVSLVTPVSETPKSTPPPDALIIPAVAHADGFNSSFQSDVRVTNTSPQVMKYQLTFTPSGDAGNAAGKQSTIEVEPGRTVAFDDVLQNWFTSPDSVSSTGTLEIRPLTETSSSTSGGALSGLPNLVTFASSRTFNATANGTFGQYIPAIPYANFIGKSGDALQASALTLQQIAHSSQYRTNLGFVEGSGQPASLAVSVFASNGSKLLEFPVELAGGQHLQMNSFLADKGVTLSDGRVEVRVTSDTGRVTAYASVLDNNTADPLLVSPVALGQTGNTKFVVPGVADLSTGIANWRTDMRLFNASASAVNATLRFYAQTGGEPQTVRVSLAPGEVRQFDGTLSGTFGVTNNGGAVHIETDSPANLVATARTYNQTSSGTYGQFIQAVTPNEAASIDSRPLQILQVEESDRFRSNIGLAEVNGRSAKVEITVVPPDSRIAGILELDLAPNEFRQLNSILESFGMDNTYNARISVRVLEGEGRITAYASVIDAITQDPTYVPAQ